MSVISVSQGFERLISRYGSNFSLAQGLGGNCSIKSSSRMKVKASGQRMAAVRNPHFFYEVSLKDSGFSDDVVGQTGKPSIEVYLHALLPFKYVVHLHSTRAIAFSMTSRFHFENFSDAENGRIHSIPFTKPGLGLMESLRGIVLDPDGFSSVLQNHGIVVAANSVSKLNNRVQELENLTSPKMLLVKDLLSPERPDNVIPSELKEHTLWHAQRNWRATPDHVVFLGSTPDQGVIDALNDCSTVGEFLEAMRGQGKSKTQQEQALWFITLANMLPRERLQVLSVDAAEDLRGWESEKLRVSRSRAERVDTL